jgi:hypothetical protein
VLELRVRTEEADEDDLVHHDLFSRVWAAPRRLARVRAGRCQPSKRRSGAVAEDRSVSNRDSEASREMARFGD